MVIFYAPRHSSPHGAFRGLIQPSTGHVGRDALSGSGIQLSSENLNRPSQLF